MAVSYSISLSGSGSKGYVTVTASGSSGSYSCAGIWTGYSRYDARYASPNVASWGYGAHAGSFPNTGSYSTNFNITRGNNIQCGFGFGEGKYVGPWDSGHRDFTHWVETTVYWRTATFNANGGSGGGSVGGYPGESLTASGTPSRTGYSFAGWYTAASGGSYVCGGSGAFSMPDSNPTYYAHWTANNYYFDLNGSEHALTDVTINGSKVGNQVRDYYTQHPYGSSYTVNNINPDAGYYNAGSSSYSGTMSGATTITLNIQKSTYNFSISHWTWGYKNGEGNNGSKDAFQLDNTSFSGVFESTQTMGSARAVSLPNGFSLRNRYGTSYISGTWTGYDINTSFTVKAANGSFEYDYDPIDYNITYTMNGGTNASSNPSTYNVLYGVTFANPTRSGYNFTGWTINGSSVTGINPGANASFSSATDLRNQCAARTTGNKTVVANWLEVKPSNLSITGSVVDPFTINLNWSATGLNISNYTVYYNGQSKNCGTNTSTTLTGLAEETTYTIYFTATNPGGTTTSSSITFTTPADQAKIRIKKNGSWLKGKTYFKKNGQWVKAKKIYIKKNGSWVIGSNYDPN